MKNMSLAMSAMAVMLAAAASADAPSLFKDGEFLAGCNYWASDSGIYMWRRRSVCSTTKQEIRLCRLQSGAMK